MADILKSPYVSATLQATFMNMVSYVVGEVVLSLKDGSGFVVDIDYNALGRLMSWAVVITPVGLLWQQKLDSRFPSTKPKYAIAGGTAATEGDKQPEVYDQLNIFIKVVLSETIFSIFANSAFIAYITYIEHGDLTLTKAKVLNEVPGLWTSSIKVWPLVSYISFGFVPPSKRVAFTSMVALIWSVYVNVFIISK
ncbi:hypothetical protein V1520DRAFT_299839 [Lipomyces starkeyi]|uniref:Uncharacterized protein n=1 Tax=Lipomyces starkeyi NRRL Y-11557 TaxID=675824 RepID=A0A1E3PVD0_LIPST|nr:hypothetical protein LIPSTDRAFT_7012 [Lipomyces starkeyi NRRL Y-11557]